MQRVQLPSSFLSEVGALGRFTSGPSLRLSGVRRAVELPASMRARHYAAGRALIAGPARLAVTAELFLLADRDDDSGARYADEEHAARLRERQDGRIAGKCRDAGKKQNSGSKQASHGTPLGGRFDMGVRRWL